MPVGLGYAEPVAIEIAIDDFARSVRRWSALIGAEPTVRDYTDTGRRRARYTARSFAQMDLVEAGIEVAAGDTRLTLFVPDLQTHVDAVARAGGVTERLESGDFLLPARFANGVDVVFTARRPKAYGQPMIALPYVLDITVTSIRASAAIWDAIMGVEGTYTSRETDSAGQFDMRHYVTAGECHAIGLMEIQDGLFIKRDSLGSSHRFVQRTRGEGTVCLGFIFKEGLDAHIAALSEKDRDVLIFEEPRSYQMGRNNMSHADQTGGVSVVIAQHFAGWDGDPRGAKVEPA